jgi:hypothetical protein
MEQRVSRLHKHERESQLEPGLASGGESDLDNAAGADKAVGVLQVDLVVAVDDAVPVQEREPPQHLTARGGRDVITLRQGGCNVFQF